MGLKFFEHQATAKFTCITSTKLHTKVHILPLTRLFNTGKNRGKKTDANAAGRVKCTWRLHKGFVSEGSWTTASTLLNARYTKARALLQLN